MPAPTAITVQQLSRLVGTPSAPVVVYVRTMDDFEADPRVVPGAIRHDWRDATGLADRLAKRSVHPSGRTCFQAFEQGQSPLVAFGAQRGGVWVRAHAFTPFMPSAV